MILNNNLNYTLNIFQEGFLKSSTIIHQHHFRTWLALWIPRFEVKLNDSTTWMVLQFDLELAWNARDTLIKI